MQQQLAQLNTLDTWDSMRLEWCSTRSFGLARGMLGHSLQAEGQHNRASSMYCRPADRHTAAQGQRSARLQEGDHSTGGVRGKCWHIVLERHILAQHAQQGQPRVDQMEAGTADNQHSLQHSGVTNKHVGRCMAGPRALSMHENITGTQRTCKAAAALRSHTEALLSSSGADAGDPFIAAFGAAPSVAGPLTCPLPPDATPLAEGAARASSSAMMAWNSGGTGTATHVSCSSSPARVPSPTSANGRTVHDRYHAMQT